MVFGHALNDSLKRIVSDVLNNLKNPRQAARRVKVGLKLGFIRTKQVYQLVFNKNVANTSGKKKQAGSTKK
ncbi:hypothetical protein Tco_1085867, partial [Tanacetum coccineum]